VTACPITRNHDRSIERAIRSVRRLAARWFPSTPPVVWAAAAERFAAADYPAAAGLLERLVNLGRTGRTAPAGGFAPDIIGPAARMNLGMCHLHPARWDEAKGASRGCSTPRRTAAGPPGASARRTSAAAGRVRKGLNLQPRQ
jgi:hypothetical protein